MRWRDVTADPLGDDIPADLLHRKALPPFAVLRGFEDVGRVGAIRKAATILSLDHTVLSRHIRYLEEWVGVALFQVTERRTRLIGRERAITAPISAACRLAG